jgi:hypothetical protein
VHWEWLALKRSPSAEFEHLGKVFLQSDKLNCEGPQRVIRVGLTPSKRLPVYPKQQTLGDHGGMSVSCQQETFFRPQSMASSGLTKDELEDLSHKTSGRL